MKMILAMTLMVFSLNSFAAKSETLDEEDLATKIQMFIYGYSGGSDEFPGELADIGSLCRVKVDIDKEEKPEITLKIDDKVFFSLPLNTGQKVSASCKKSKDDSFVCTYIFGFAGAYKVTLKHTDDASNKIQLSTKSTSLECVTYY